MHASQQRFALASRLHYKSIIRCADTEKLSSWAFHFELIFTLMPVGSNRSGVIRQIAVFVEPSEEICATSPIVTEAELLAIPLEGDSLLQLSIYLSLPRRTCHDVCGWSVLGKNASLFESYCTNFANRKA